MAYTLKIIMKNDQQLELTEVEEFIMGVKFFFARKTDGITLSFERLSISKISRKMRNGLYRDVKISPPKKVKDKKRFSERPHNKFGE